MTYRKAGVYGGMDYLKLSSWVAYAFVRIALGNKSGIVCRAKDFCHIRWDVSRALNSLSLRGCGSEIRKSIPVIKYYLLSIITIVKSNTVILSIRNNWRVT